MKPQQKLDPQARVRALVARYTAHGPEELEKLSNKEVHLLLSAKQLHLAQVADRCQQGQGLHVNVPLRQLLERDVREISKEINNRDRGLER